MALDYNIQVARPGANFNLQGLFGIAEKQQEERKNAELLEQRRQTGLRGAEIIKSGDVDGAIDFMMQNPDMRDAFISTQGHKSTRTEAARVDALKRILIGEDLDTVLDDTERTVLEEGGTVEDLRKFRASGATPEQIQDRALMGLAIYDSKAAKAFRESTGRGVKSKVFQPKQDPKTGKWGFPTIDPVTLRPVFVELPGVTGRTEAEKMASELEKRQKIANIGLATETRKAEERARILAETEPSRAAAVERAVGTEKERQKSQATRKASAAALGAYDSAMTDLMSALDGTESGAVVGRISMTDAQKKADAAETVASSALKDVFRKQGEGTFTDKDQEHLMNLLPKRTEPASVRKFKAQMLDDIVKRKVSGDPLTVEQIMAEMEKKRGRGAQPAAQALPPTNPAAQAAGQEVNVQWGDLP